MSKPKIAAHRIQQILEKSKIERLGNETIFGARDAAPYHPSTLLGPDGLPVVNEKREEFCPADVEDMDRFISEAQRTLGYDAANSLDNRGNL